MGFNAMVTKLLRDVPVFTAAVEATMTNKSDRSRVTMPMKLAKREDRLRMDLDLSAVKGAGMSLQSLNSLRSVGMAKIVNLMRKGTNTMEILFWTPNSIPGWCCRRANSWTGRRALPRSPPDGDLVNGYSCTKQVVTVTSPGAKPSEVLTWEAADLKGFPVRILIQDGRGQLW